MSETGAASTRRVALLFTRYPVTTETFLQREVDALKRLGTDVEVLSMWPPPLADGDGPGPDDSFSPWRLLSLFWWIPYWAVRKPRKMALFASALVDFQFPNPINTWENLLGFGYALVRARRLEARFHHIHAVWASAPATAAWALRHLTGLSYSMAGHAYDLFEHGGDGMLELKIPAADFIRTSTHTGRQRWIQHGAPPAKVHVIRRGITRLPAFDPERRCSPGLRILTVGRLVEKMGYPDLLEALDLLRQAGMDFHAEILGGGALQGELEARCRLLGLGERVEFAGAVPFREVAARLEHADVFIFAGQVARSGDRAGFPNAIGEAMAWGVPVVARPAGAVCEGIRHRETGLLWETPAEAAAALLELSRSPGLYAALRRNARQWVEREFDAVANMRQLAALLEHSLD